MFQKDRYEQIYSILQERQSATVRYLQNSLHVSEATVRRDLSEMENLGLLQRVWGGAMLQTTADKDPPAFVRVKANNEKKAKIASIASRIIRESSSIFIDGSTTAMHLVPYFAKFKQLTFITNGLQMQQMLIEQTNANVYLIGGQLFEKRITTGPMAIADVKKFYADVFFFSCSGISAESGITGIETRSCEVCAEMMHRATTKVLLCDSTKASKNYLWHLADFDQTDYVVMDSVPDDGELVRAIGKRLITYVKQL